MKEILFNSRLLKLCCCFSLLFISICVNTGGTQSPDQKRKIVIAQLVEQADFLQGFAARQEGPSTDTEKI